LLGFEFAGRLRLTRSDSGTVAISTSILDLFDFDWIQQLIAHAPESGSTGKRDLGAEAGAASLSILRAVRSS